MKKILLLLVIATVPLFGFSQKPLKHAKQITIVIDSTKSQEVIVKELVAYLTHRGYDIENYNKDLNLITTKGKAVKFWHIRLNIFIEQDKLQLTGKAFAEMLGFSESWTVENKGSLGSVYVHTWKEINETALGFPHSDISYQL